MSDFIDDVKHLTQLCLIPNLVQIKIEQIEFRIKLKLTRECHLNKDGGCKCRWQGQNGAAAPDQPDPNPESRVRVPRGKGGHDCSVSLKGHC